MSDIILANLIGFNFILWQTFFFALKVLSNVFRNLIKTINPVRFNSNSRSIQQVLIVTKT